MTAGRLRYHDAAILRRKCPTASVPTPFRPGVTASSLPALSLLLRLSQLWKSLVICLLIKTVTYRVASISLRILARVVPIEDSTCPGPHVSDQRFLLRLRNACSWLRSERPGRASPSKTEICDQNPSADGSSQEGSKLGRTRRTSDEYPPLTGPRHGHHCQ